MVSVFSNTEGEAGIDSHVTVHLGVSGNRIALRCQGGVSPIYGISWPHQHPLTPAQAKGAVQSIEIDAPAAGEDFSSTLPGTFAFELLAASVSLVADDNVADRTLSLILELGGQEVYLTRTSPATQQAEETIFYYFVAGGTSGVTIANEEHEVGLPLGIVLPPGASISTSVDDIQVGDQLSSVVIVGRKIYQLIS
jgi:hypothetical protein